MRLSKILSGAIAGALATAILFSCKSPRPTKPVPLAVSLRLKWVYDPGFAGEMVAKQSGIFARNGLNVTLKPGGFESDPIKLVASGSDTFGVTGADTFLLARSQGVPVVAIAAGYLQSPVVFYVHSDAGIDTPAGLRGKRVGVQAGQDTFSVFQALLAHSGMTIQDVKQVPVKYDLSPFLIHRVDVWPGYAATQSFTLDKQNIPYKELRPRDYGVSYLGTVYFTSESFLAAHPEVVQQFVSSVVEGWRTAYANLLATVADVTSFDPKNLTAEYTAYALDKQRDYILPAGRRFGEFDHADWTATEKELLRSHILSSSVDIDAGVNYGFLKSYYSSPSSAK